MIVEPIFHSAHDALLFAFKYPRNQFERPAYAKMADGGSREGRGLGGQDGAGQAGMILRRVDELPPTHAAIIRALYAPRTKPCTCCGGDTRTVEFSMAIREISNAAIAALSGCASNNRLREGIVYRLFGEKVVLAELAEYCGVDQDTATKHNQRVTVWLRGEKLSKPNRRKGEQERALDNIEELLLDSGHIARAA